mgnify:FL=1
MPVKKTYQNTKTVVDVFENEMNVCKRFVKNICQSWSIDRIKTIKMVDDIKTNHDQDNGQASYITLGITHIKCDNHSVFDTELKTCSEITIKRNQPISQFRRTLVHELIHAELHERRQHPLNVHTTVNSNSSKLEEGICVLVEFLAAGLGFNANNTEFQRTVVTDEYMRRLETASNTEYEKNYESGFALALTSMVKNKVDFLNLLNYYVFNGDFIVVEESN